MTNTIARNFSIGLILSLALAISGCVTTGSNPPEQKRRAVLEMKEGVLQDLYAIKPSVKAQIAAAPGYAVFSNANISVIFASFSGGYGVVKNNHTGKHTYMNMGEVGVGLGAGVKDFRVVFVFHKEDSMQRFVEQGWAFGGQADAAAKAGDKGAAVGGEAMFDNVTVYQLTESGLALQATLKGTKYWKDAELN
ncbi:MAG: hypothetical protein H6995_00835 [Pseudomonadales bacterium]|nr:hypothetical protein [Pseudomonadales bacterium]MCP5213542.1 hypothetical protein [Pseudomonadales bacterium]